MKDEFFYYYILSDLKEEIESLNIKISYEIDTDIMLDLLSILESKRRMWLSYKIKYTRYINNNGRFQCINKF